MESAASAAETAAFVAGLPGDPEFVAFAELRQRSVRMTEALPTGWIVPPTREAGGNGPRRTARTTAGDGYNRTSIADTVAPVQELRHYLGPSLRDIWALHPHPHVVYCAALGHHAVGMLNLLYVCYDL